MWNGLKSLEKSGEKSGEKNQKRSRNPAWKSCMYLERERPVVWITPLLCECSCPAKEQDLHQENWKKMQFLVSSPIGDTDWLLHFDAKIPPCKHHRNLVNFWRPKIGSLFLFIFFTGAGLDFICSVHSSAASPGRTWRSLLDHFAPRERKKRSSTWFHSKLHSLPTVAPCLDGKQPWRWVERRK